MVKADVFWLFVLALEWHEDKNKEERTFSSISSISIDLTWLNQQREGRVDIDNDIGYW